MVIQIAATARTRYIGPSYLSYKRVNLSNAYADIRPIVTDVGAPSLHKLLPKLNKHLGLTLTEEDILNANIDWLGNNEQVNLLIKAKENAFGYEGQVIVQYNRVRPLLQNVLSERTVDALTHPTDPPGVSLSLRTWGLDFSAVVDTLSITATGQWADITAVRTLMRSLGYSTWPQADATSRLSIVPTSQLDGANARFESVIVQTGIDDVDGQAGDAYFHFTA